MSEVVLPIVYQLGAGGIIGVVVGYAVKKMMKIVAVILGIFALALIYMEYKGIVNVNYEKLSELVEKAYGGTGSVSQWLTPIVAHLPFAGTFFVGFAIGFKAG